MVEEKKEEPVKKQEVKESAPPVKVVKKKVESEFSLAVCSLDLDRQQQHMTSMAI